MPPLPRLEPPKKPKRSVGYGPHQTGAALIKKQTIKRVAARLFAERGVAAVGLASVGMVAQLPNRGVNYYYRNREDLLGDILVDHVIGLTQSVGAAHDATETEPPVLRLMAMVLAFHQAVLGGRDAHRAMLFNLALLPPQLQSAILGRYRILLDSFIEPFIEVIPQLTRPHATAALLPILERLLSGPVFWVEPVPAPATDPDTIQRHAHVLVEMLLAAARAIALNPPVLADAAAAEQPGWLAPLRADAAPHATWHNFSPARADTVVDTGTTMSASRDAVATRARRIAGLEHYERISAREALHRWYEVLPIAASGVTFVITSREHPLALLGPLSPEAAASSAGGAGAASG